MRPRITLWSVTAASTAPAALVVACLGVLLPLALAAPAPASAADLTQPLRTGPRLPAPVVGAPAARRPRRPPGTASATEYREHLPRIAPTRTGGRKRDRQAGPASR
ncbi:hypothetical protein [Embleya sp. NPDC050493]|uniref:hypothetical protein n=1 Tax=Embleya sp. NPDC050493 TaxID=3363989 RepID=UPI003796C0C0